MDKKHFIYIIKPVKENFNETQTPEDSKIMSDHFMYLKDLMDKGNLVLAAPETSAKFGIAIFKADSMEHAKELTENDPAVKNNVMKAEIYQIRISLFSHQ